MQYPLLHRAAVSRYNPGSRSVKAALQWTIDDIWSDISREPRSHGGLQELFKTVEHCDSRHQLCARDWMTRLPKRVLDVRGAGTTGRVKSRETDREYSTYIALSYWYASCFTKSHGRPVLKQLTWTQLG